MRASQPARGGTRNRTQTRRGRRRPSRRRNPGLAVALALSTAILGGTVYVLGHPDALPAAGRSAGTARGRVVPPSDNPRAAGDAAPAAPTTTPTTTPAAPARESATAPKPVPTASPSGSQGTGPTSGSGSFTIAGKAAAPVGQGTIRRFRVEVEDGSGVDPEAAATQIQGILADHRGWTKDGRNGFQLVSSGPYDFTVKIASPTTVDRICGAAGLDTQGEVNCDVGSQVMVNTKRWNTGSPQFSGPLDEYRALIVNHEVGHRIGHGHEDCPGKGKPAPAMMQQIHGLKGCLPNAWPYTDDGTYLGGPAAP
ncbi:DUF3152 domain-containing protein [Kitasatospora sp. NPDC050543]|uniref:DUF3152 domain-containing protein n=1 Tax=Kitasatospora sp. NPDC050543 TaxID=3364054 RepID=UPI0037AB67A7